ncbi:hypothetical protein KIPB_000354 [Kipferlia bialata]|uniref:Ferritin-like diiron domain-containing protein n=1 Tax=Kipferlia bialata TaxID=797122 RepID=A0A9K3GEF5_9EUKA|nr:hypothetical protein KIPB_000354 [Kipferlia bialata]|eukprot:g354.t1
MSSCTNELLYRAFAVKWRQEGWNGLSDFFEAQAVEERGHHLRVVEHILNRGGTFTFESLPASPATFIDTISCAEAFVAREAMTSRMYVEALDLAGQAKDPFFGGLVKWFLKAQVLEEAEAGDFLRLAQSFAKMGAMGTCHMSQMVHKLMPNRETQPE